MKKFVSVLLCVTMILSFVACSSTKETEEKHEVVEEKVMTIEEMIDSIDGLRELGYDSLGGSHVEYFETIEKDYAVIDMDANTADGENWSLIDQLHNKLGFTSALMEKISETRPIDGVQTEENENYKISWSYSNPRLKIIYEMK